MIVALLALALAPTALPSRRHHVKQRSGVAGNFDFYVLVLSWSPEFCYSHPNAGECSQHKGFLVHGLWPQNTDGTYPQNCQTSQPAPTNPESMSDIMPGEIVRHEWLTHGTCSGLNGDNYFALIRKLYNSIRIPDTLKQPTRSATLSTSQMKHEFEQANSQLRDDEIVVQLRGNYLNSIQFLSRRVHRRLPSLAPDSTTLGKVPLSCRPSVRRPGASAVILISGDPFEFARICAPFCAHTATPGSRKWRRNDAGRRAGCDGGRDDAYPTQLLRGGAQAGRRDR